jgi:endonuclease/exonuclease/phosphatase family metal-dependent hydrolase
MATFLFWNMQRKALREPLFRLVHRHEVDVLVLAESGFSPAAVLELLNREETRYHFPETFALESEKVHVFTRFSGELLEPRLDHSGSRWTIRQLFLPGVLDVLVVAVHLPSKVNWDDQSQSSLCTLLAEDVRRIENSVGHQRTIIMGDFNMNPFEAGMIGAFGLHAESTRAKANIGSRSVHGRDYPFFYNPMWNFFGDSTRGPAGTFHFSSSKPVRMSWNMFDQILVRPELLPFFNTDQLEILTGDGEDSFLTTRSGVPGANNSSDHLPLVFKLNL